MQTQLNPYLNFRNTTRQAMEFYHTIFGGNLTMNTYKEFQVSQDPAEDDKIMHSMLNGDNGITFMAADTPNSMAYIAGTGMSMSLSGDNMEILSGYFEKLAVGGTVVEPLAKSPWGDMFGMVTDQFGVRWMVNIAPVA